MTSPSYYFTDAGKKGGHKGRAKRYVSPEEVEQEQERQKREQDWKVISEMLVEIKYTKSSSSFVVVFSLPD